MKIEHKIILSNALNLALIAIIGIFAIQSLNSMLTKLRFVEIADDLNVAFLDMRLSEKNYFLYNDTSALVQTEESIARTRASIDSVRNDIERAIGKDDVQKLERYLNNYALAVNEVKRTNAKDETAQDRLRTQGRILREFSSSITALERSRVNKIISHSKQVMVYSFFALLLLVMIIGHRVSRGIVGPIKQVEMLTSSISTGHFDTIESSIPNDETGAVIKAINSMSEELKHREEQIIQSKKLASIGVLVAGVAHEINNPLNNISMIAQTYIDLYAKLSDEQRLEFMRKIDGEGDRLKSIVKNLLDFAKPKEPNLSLCDLNEITLKTLSLVQNMLDISNIETSLNLVEGLPGIMVDRAQIQQVLVNIIVNAIQATSPGGKITISTRLSGEPDFVEVGVLDTGRGIPPEFLHHIFDPFFSTKEEGGTGLGLSVSYGIIKKHGGEISVESKVGTGTVFTVRLPVYKNKGDNAWQKGS